MFKVLTLTTVLVFTSVASATITAGHELWSAGRLPDSGHAYFSYRLRVDVSDTVGMGADDWTAAGLDVDLTGGSFFQYPHGWPPDPPPWYGDAEYDSYYTSPGGYPNPDWEEGVTGVAWSADTATRLDTDWFDTMDTGNGSFVIAQFTVLPSDSDWMATGHLQYVGAHTGGEIFDYYFTLPEPATLSLLALGVVAIAKRRR